MDIYVYIYIYVSVCIDWTTPQESVCKGLSVSEDLDVLVPCFIGQKVRKH